MRQIDSILENLRQNGFRLTPQRLAIIEFLVGNKDHPNAEKIYGEIKKRYPMISLSTVYNTLEALKSIGEVSELSVSNESVRFDPDTRPHHHFYCLKCCGVKDIFREIEIPRDQVDGHRVQSWRVYFYGTCSDCLKKQPKEV